MRELERLYGLKHEGQAYSTKFKSAKLILRQVQAQG